MRNPATSSDPAEFRIDDQGLGSSARLLIVHGDADLYSAPELRERMRSAIDGGASDVVVDFSDAAVVDSTSLGVLLGAMRRLHEQDGQIHLVVPRADVRRVFEITMLDRIFPLHETQEEALTALSDQAT